MNQLNRNNDLRRMPDKELEEERRRIVRDYFRDLFNQRSKELKKTQEEFGALLGVSQGAIWQRFNTGKISAEFASQILQFLQIEIEDIDQDIWKLISPASTFQAEQVIRQMMLDKGKRATDNLLGMSPPEATRSPRMDYTFVPKTSLTAGLGDGALDIQSEQVVDTLAFRNTWITAKGLDSSKLALINCTGDSMAPTLVDGDLALVDLRKKELEDGIYALAIDNSIKIKRIKVRMDGSVIVISDNDRYEAESYDSSQAAEFLRHIGKVVWVGRELI